MIDLDILRRKIGFKRVQGALGGGNYIRRLPHAMMSVTHLHANRPPTDLDDPVLVWNHGLDGRRWRNPVAWNALKYFVTTMGGLNE